MSKFTSTDRVANQSGNEPLDAVIDRFLSRRTVMKGGLGAAIAMIAGAGLTGCFDGGSDNDDDDRVTEPTPEPSLQLGFESIPGSKIDAIAIAAGYTARVLAPWGTPLNNMARAWDETGNNTSEDQANSAGMHHDGMHFFPLNDSSTEGLLAINYEYIDQDALHPNGATNNNGVRPAEEVRKEINAHGAGVYLIRRNAEGVWEVALDNRNRRFTSATEMAIAGPLAGNAALITPFSADGTRTRGTNNNCGNGYTPWGTYLTCEENWPGIFLNTQAETPADQDRIGIETEETNYGWETAAGEEASGTGEFSRFNITPTAGGSATTDYRNEANGYGYIVEIDPYDESTLATKRTAMGRFRHEGAAYGNLVAGEPVVYYMGDDAQFEYVYKYVSDAAWDPADTNPSDRLATGAKYLDNGTLYVARFNDDGSGDWLPLVPETTVQSGGTLADLYTDLPGIILNTRGAADAVGATPMDRPEWTTVHPTNGDVYLTLTNNSRRTEANAANPRVPNVNGHIIRWTDASETTFNWDIFVFGSDDDTAATNLSGLTELNQFAGPDGLSFDSRGILWIETDNSGNAVADYTNDQLLAVIPERIVDAEGNRSEITAENQTALRRMLVGPNGCEITGIAFTPDLTTMFVNVQHPGNWPYDALDATTVTPTGTEVRPRASTVVIQKIDGGQIGV
ncbi:PhoX family protein [Pseudomonas matsuisoli]|uniref:dTDP-D-glucose 4,6-dehydratase n=1 Tax=Pseudomonas matsuisoli TaxID=1515666 RepID=A0A917Q1N2_9PSED|nr:PhoX family phosphatase [Pseudomonas matsuisoli]GGK07228.1 dTDP-D-glucose 4,6-dehydratase [Pseudomonas matsuisoli]